MRVGKMLFTGLLMGAAVLPARAGAVQDRDADSDFKAYLEEVRQAATDREVCEKSTNYEPDLDPNPVAGHETDPRLIDADLYVIEKSSDAQCVKRFVWSVEGSVNLVNHKHGKISEKQWKKIGDTLIGILNNERLNIQDWSIEASVAAETLEKMGPSYRQAAYDWHLRALRKIAEEKVITDDLRVFAMQLVWHLLNVGQKIPTELLREVVQKFDLIKFVRTYELKESASFRAKDEERITEVERLLKAK